MARKRINEEEMNARLPAGTLKRADAVLRERESRAELVRLAIEREIERREAAEEARHKRYQERMRRSVGIQPLDARMERGRKPS
jgi:hypothetical protein